MAERIRRQLMQNTPELFPDQQDPRFGTPHNVPIFHTFESRKACSAAGVHSPTYAGIHGTQAEGAFSICLSGGYKDDQDGGEFIYYTGTGGQENSFSGGGRQVDDQTFAHPDNAALLKSVETKRPVRVVRGFNAGSEFAPPTGYRYDGMYVVEKAYLAKGDSGYAVCTYELRRVAGQPPIPKKHI